MIYGILSALPMAVCVFWALLLLLDARRNDRAKRFLTVFMGVAAMLYVCHYVYFNRAYDVLPLTDTIYAFCTLAVYPLYYIYIKLLCESGRLEPKDGLLLVPAAVSFVVCAVVYAMMEAGERDAYVGHVIYGNSDPADVSTLAVVQHARYRLAGVMLAVQIINVLVLGGRKIARYNKRINDYYSNTEGKTFWEVRTLLVFFVITSIASFVMNIIGKTHFVDSVWLILIPSLLFATLLYTVGYFGYRQQFTVVDFALDETQSEMAECDLVDESVSAQEYWKRRRALREKTIELLEGEELYKDPALRITDLAAKIGSNRAYVSRIINQDLQTSFSDLINSYRVEHAKKLLRGANGEANGGGMSIDQVSEQSGFSSESSFYRIFKNNTGLSPKAWQGKQSAGG